MTIMKNLWSLLTVLLVVVFSMCFTSCGDDDSGDGGSSGINGYYIEGSLYTNTDFKNDNVWWNMQISKEAAEYYGNTLTFTLFDSNGHFFPRSSDGGYLWLEYEPTFIRVDDNCIYSYSGISLYQLGASGTSGRELLYKFDAGEYGTLGFYGLPDAIYVYTRDGNRLIMDVGDGKHTNTFVITDGGLVLSGGGSYTKYNPNTTY